MALRLLEILSRSERMPAVRSVLDGHAPLGLWEDRIAGDMSMVRVLIDAGETEELIDELATVGTGDEAFRLILLPVEATLPRPPEKEPEEAAADGSGDATPARPRRSRVNREELYAQISETTRSLPVFATMTALSALVAALGIHTENVPAIVGAMVIAPLLGPNMALALATTLGDLTLARRAVIVNGLGVAIVLALGFALGLIVEIDPTNPELLARTRIGEADVALALGSGVAGALAFTTGLSAVLIGVMVAVALVPPTVTLALVLGAGEWELAGRAAMLLAATIICVNLAAVGTFLVQGIHPAGWWERDRARRGAWIAAAAWVVLLAILLLLIGLATGCGRSETPDASGPGPSAPSPPAPTGAVTDDASSRLVRLRNVGLARIEAEEHAEAARVFGELLALIPDEPMVHANLGLIALREGDMPAARRHLEEAARRAPGHAGTALLLARAATLDGREADALAALRGAAARNPDDGRVRWALAEILRRERNPSDAIRAEVRSNLGALLVAAPDNVAARLALARALTESGDAAEAARQLAVLESQGVVDEGPARELLGQARARLAAGDAAAARSAVIGLDNVMKPTRAWQASLLEVAGPPVQIGEPVWDFVATEVAEPAAGPRRVPLRFTKVEDDGLSEVEADHAVVLTAGDETRPTIAVARGGRITILAAAGGARYAETATFALAPEPGVIECLLALDWTNDRRMDLVAGMADGSVWLWSAGDDGAWTAEPALPARDGAAVGFAAAWDADQDGDLDLLVGRAGAPVALLRNNGDRTWTDVARELGLDASLIAAAVIDVEEDGDLDLVAVDEAGRVRGWANERSGRFGPMEVGPESTIRRFRDVAAADIDNDGWIDLVATSPDGRCVIGRNREGDGFAFDAGGDTGASSARAASLDTLDFDNDGWLDLLFVSDAGLHLLENIGERRLPPWPDDANGSGVRAAEPADRDGDGDLDLLVVHDDGSVAFLDNSGAPGHGWQSVVLEAILQGSQKNPSFGVGGRIEIRAGRAYQKRLVRGPVTHFGLGASGPVDAIRVIWPNGVPQNVVLPAPDTLVVEKQTLKGSCPFLFAFDGESEKFVTDLLWRSPLGMKINAQTVALTGTTRDYVKIEASQLQPKDGRYEMTITAALWETIFFDEIELLAVDRPADLDVFLDERFVAPSFPGADLTVVETLRAPVAAVDHRGRDVLEIVAHRDGRRLGGFARGRYQGIAEPHFVEIDLGAWDEEETGTPVKLIASGWIMPTDTSINVAMGQGDHPPPAPLTVSVADGAGGWRTAIPDAGFPSGKLKTVVLDLTGRFPTADHRVRLATNLEIYWDRIAFAVGAPAFAPRPAPVACLSADLVSVGFPEMKRRDDTAPEIPDYTSPSRAPRWRDLHGWYTRYGAVGPLLEATDDRYVIMNAGDGIRLSFEAGPPPPPGWRRDFILVTDGWVKDGDWNTVASKTVAPLPFHGMTGYPYPADAAPPEIRPDHSDWREYHTRYVTSQPFRDRLRP